MEVDKFRFFIRDESNNQISSIWNIHHQNNEVYCYVASLGSRMKLSLHSQTGEDGKDSQFGFQSDYRSKLKSQEIEDVRPLRWKRKDPTEGQYVNVVTLIFPTNYLKSKFPKRKINKKKIKFSLLVAPQGKALAIYILFTKNKRIKDEEEFIKNGFTPLVHMNLPNKDDVLVVARNMDFKDEVIPKNDKKGKLNKLDGWKDSKEIKNNLNGLIFNCAGDCKPFEIIETGGISVKK